MPNRGADRVLARLFVTPRMMASRPISNCYPAGETRRPRLGGDRAGGAGTLGRATLGRGTLGGGTAALALILAMAASWLVVVAAPAHAGPWRIEALALEGPLTRIHPGSDAAGQKPALLAGGRWFAISACGESVCLVPGTAPDERISAAGGLPDGAVARGTGLGVVRAWYGQPTRRYRHGVLGDDIEAGALAAASASGKRLDHILGSGYVFEDITPRLSDLDGDGKAEIVAIRTDVTAGASLAVYGERGGKLRRLAATAAIGRPNRWLNVAGIADFDGDGRPEIAIVKTPHIGGKLEFWSYRNDGGAGRLVRRGTMAGFSNHFIGSRNLSLSTVFDADGDGIADLAVPDTARTALRLVSLREGKLSQTGLIALPSPLTQNIALVRGPGGPILVCGLANGALIAISKR